MVKNTLNGLKHSLYNWVSARHHYIIIKRNQIKKNSFLFWVYDPSSIAIIAIRITVNMAYLRKENQVIKY